METLKETIEREIKFLAACKGVQADRIRASLIRHLEMWDAS